MAEQRNPRDLVTQEDLVISTLWAIAALGKGLERPPQGTIRRLT